MIVKPDMPEIHLPFLQPSRYKTASSGRNSLKSWTFAKLMIAKRMHVKSLGWCTREIQLTLKDSVHKLLKDTVERLSVQDYWEITDKRFYCKHNESEIIFSGLKDLNKDNIKSKEAVDDCWCEEAQYISQESLDVLLPTVRKPGSEIWFSLNPDYEDGAVYKNFVLKKRDDNILIQKNYCDVLNFCSPEIIKLAEECKREDPAKYRHIWLGQPVGVGSKIYPMFDESVHVREYSLTSEEFRVANHWCSIDPHPTYYPFILWGAVLPNDVLWIYNEFPYKGFNGSDLLYHEQRNQVRFDYTLRDIANIINALDGTSFGVQNIRRTIDPRYQAISESGNSMSGMTGLVQKFAEVGISNFTLPKFETTDIQRMEIQKDLSSYNKHDMINSVNCPKIQIAPWCVNMIESLKLHRMDDKGKREDEKYKDPCDALRYMRSAMGGVIKWREKVNESDRLMEEVNQFTLGTMLQSSSVMAAR